MKRPVPGQRNSYDITLVNMDYVQDVKVTRHNDPGERQGGIERVFTANPLSPHQDKR